jgi:hydrogenase maturation protease
VLVIGIGNPDRGDDAVGWAVASAIAEICDTAVSSGGPAGLIDLWRDRSRVVLVDAVRGEGTPGEMIIVDLLSSPLPVAAVSSSHGMGPIEAVELARALDALPESLTLVGIEGKRFDHSSGLSVEARRGAAQAIEVISNWAHGSPGSDAPTALGRGAKDIRTAAGDEH